MKKLWVNLLDGTISEDGVFTYYGYMYPTYDRDLALGICEDIKRRKVRDAEDALERARKEASKCPQPEECIQCEPRRWWKK